MSRTLLATLAGVLVAALIIALDTTTAHAQFGRGGTVTNLSIGSGSALPPTSQYWGPSYSYAPRYGSRPNSQLTWPQPWYVYRSGPYTYYRPSRTLYGPRNTQSYSGSGQSRTKGFGWRFRR